MLVDICMKIHEDRLKRFQVLERTLWRHGLVMVKVPREITKPEDQLSCKPSPDILASKAHNIQNLENIW